MEPSLGFGVPGTPNSVPLNPPLYVAGTFCGTTYVGGGLGLARAPSPEGRSRLYVARKIYCKLVRANSPTRSQPLAAYHTYDSSVYSSMGGPIAF
eukprot:COSAG02_NODE_7511_length_2977_cov_1.102119_3_plen_95_part_00